MKIKFSLLHTLRLVAACAALFAAGAYGADVPKHKPGLWEIKTGGRVNSASSNIPLQFCVGKDTDNILNLEGKLSRQECDAPEVETGENRIRLRVRCSVTGGSVTTESVFEGTLDSAYHGKINYTIETRNGRREFSITQEARWLGPCEAGQKPGDVILPNKERVGADEIMKDPKILGRIRRHQQHQGKP
ncbi:MAG: DUF3617 family protein [Candidatus Accumulibacter sp.]|jgi:hypothetical protein|nr:DUF3617 family protein [Accumulibacter sp.]